MPWRETSAVAERFRFVEDTIRGLYTHKELCEVYGISRPTGYKWLRRFEEEGVLGLEERSRAPHHCPHRMDREIERYVVEARRKHPSWGPKKLRRWLGRRHLELDWPAPSTMGELLKREGLIEPRPYRRRGLNSPLKRPRCTASRPNEIWTADYKGEFRTRDGRYCYPLTAADLYSRYLLDCRAMLKAEILLTRKTFERLFRDKGLPLAILTDAGTPFASQGLGRLSRLSAWWIRLGIQPMVIQPSHPEQNGCHERMHRTLKAETTRPPGAHLKAQQRRFDKFRHEYNTERPHESLEMSTPADHYEPSARPYPPKLPPLDYPGHFVVRRVLSNGCIAWKSRRIFLSSVLISEDIGLEEVDDGLWSFYYGHVLLARYQERLGQLVAPRAIPAPLPVARTSSLCNC